MSASTDAKLFCATLVLDNSGSEIVGRLSNKVYELARSNKLELSGFPDFTPLVERLREGTSNAANPRQYRVCLQQGNKLKILESFAEKWTSTPSTAERATNLITDHNAQYNPDAEWWIADKILGWKFFVFQTSERVISFKPLKVSYVSCFQRIPIRTAASQSDAQAQERPAKRIKVNPSDAVSAEKLSSLVKPFLVINVWLDMHIVLLHSNNLAKKNT